MFSWKSKELLLRHCEDIAKSDDVPLQVADAAPVAGDDVEAAIPPPATGSMILQNAKHLSPIWYRNWSNVGIALCILYNICIVSLLVMGFFQFIKHK